MVFLWKITLLFSACSVFVDGACKFPQELRGKWHQAGLGAVDITEQTITTKGDCHESEGEFYVVQNKERSCHKCLLLMRRHRNVIQYKESYCGSMSDFQTICRNGIRVEAVLYTLIRDSAVSEPSPFQGNYNLHYDNNTSGYCREPVSHVKQCAGESKFKFHFKHCPGIMYTSNIVKDFNCLATWKDGSSLYMYGQFGSREREYRCFIYEVMGTLVEMAVSADATCRGLRSATDGPLLMQLQKTDADNSMDSCTLPNWFTKKTWQDLSGEHIYTSDVTKVKMTMSHRRGLGSGQQDALSTMKCVQLNETQTRGKHHSHQFVYISHSISGCSSPKYQCVKLWKRNRNVLEIHRGRLHEQKILTCSASDFHHDHKHLVIPLSMSSAPCPFEGRHHIQPVEQACNADFRSRCNQTDIIEIKDSCSSQASDMRFACINTWQEHGKTYLIARKADTKDRMANCFSFTVDGARINFATDQKCNIASTLLFREPLHYTFNTATVDCVDKPEVVEIDINNKPGDKDNDKYDVNVNAETRSKTKQNESSVKSPVTDGKTGSATCCRYHTANIALCAIVSLLSILRSR